MANELTYQSVFTGQEMDERFTAVAQLTAALEALTTVVAQKYVKPASGIPSTDMDADVQAALAKANSAIQSLADYYTKTEVDALFAAVNSLDYVDVASLPTASASTLGKIYLVGPDGSGYYSYYYTSYDGTNYSWVGPLGTTEINMANYATKTELGQLEAEVSDVIHGKKTYQKALIVASGNQQIALDEFNFGKKIIARIVSNTATCASVEMGVRINGSSSTYYALSEDWLMVEKTSDIDRLYFYAANTTVTGDIVVEVAYADAIPLFINESYTVDSVPTENSDNLVKSGGVYSAIKVVGDKVQDLDEEINGIPGGPLSFTENTGGYYNTSGQFVQHSGKYAEIDLSRYAGQTLTLAITNANGSSTRATCLMVNGSVIEYVLENDANFAQTWDIPDNAILRESHTAESTISISVSGVAPSILTDKYVFPKGFSWQNNPLAGHLSVGRDGDIVSDLDISSLKVQSGVTYYVSPNGNDSNTGLDAEHPLSNIRTAINKADCGTVILANGLYNIYRLPGGSTAFTKSVNLIAASGNTPIIAPYRSGGGWSKESGYDNVYAQGYGNSFGIVNLAKLDANGDYTPYTKVASIDEVEATENSWFTDSSKTYIHATASVPDNTILNLENSFPILAEYSGNETLYLEGLTVIGGNGATCRVRNVGTGRPLFVARNCKFGYPKEGNALHLLSIDSFCENCVCCYARYDGFNYHKDTGNTALPRSIELGCIGRSNGFKGFYSDGTANTDNGSTSHDGGVAIRINGQYYDNIGPNVADSGDGQQSLNLGCVAHHSKAESTQACGFKMYGDGAVMFCDTCAAFSNPYNFRAEAGTKVKMRNCAGEPTNAEGGEIWAY